MSKNYVGKTVKIPSLKKVGTVISQDTIKNTVKVQTETETIEVLETLIVIIPFLKKLWLLIKSIFSKNAK